jgi:hypothetical protein
MDPRFLLPATTRYRWIGAVALIVAIVCAASIGIRRQWLSAKLASLRVQREAAVMGVSTHAAAIEKLRAERNSVKEIALRYEQQREAAKSVLIARELSDRHQLALSQFARIEEELNQADNRMRAAEARLAQIDQAIAQTSRRRVGLQFYDYALTALAVFAAGCAAAGFALESSAQRRRDAADGATEKAEAGMQPSIG